MRRFVRDAFYKAFPAYLNAKWQDATWKAGYVVRQFVER